MMYRKIVGVKIVLLSSCRKSKADTMVGCPASLACSCCYSLSALKLLWLGSCLVRLVQGPLRSLP